MVIKVIEDGVAYDVVTTGKSLLLKSGDKKVAPLLETAYSAKRGDTTGVVLFTQQMTGTIAVEFLED